MGLAANVLHITCTSYGNRKSQKEITDCLLIFISSHQLIHWVWK